MTLRQPSENVILNFISPSYTAEKLVSPRYLDLVDVFEDRMRHWLLEPAKHLLDQQHGAVAAMSLVIAYFEGIEIYCTGKDSDRQSTQFFRRGFRRVFAIAPENEHVYDEVISALYSQMRCGFAHEGLFRKRIYFGEARPEPICVTWPRKDGRFIKDGHLESAAINPRKFVAAVEHHFNKFVAELRGEADAERTANFLAAIELQWGLNEPEHLIAMTQEEFFNGS